MNAHTETVVTSNVVSSPNAFERQADLLSAENLLTDLNEFISDLKAGKEADYYRFLDRVFDHYRPRLCIVKEFDPLGHTLHKVAIHNRRELTVLDAFRSENGARSFMAAIGSVGTYKLASNALHAVSSMRTALDLAEKIASASEEQGSENYATKAHMRSWASRIVAGLRPAIGAFGLRVEAQ